MCRKKKRFIIKSLWIFTNISPGNLLLKNMRFFVHKLHRFFEMALKMYPLYEFHLNTINQLPLSVFGGIHSNLI